MEIWKPICRYENYYEISTFGNVRSITRIVPSKPGVTRIEDGQLLKLQINTRGYLKVGLSANNFDKKHFVHRLVALAFVDNPDNLPFVNHKDFNKKNNYFGNLEWVTARQNNQHYRKGLIIATLKEINPLMIFDHVAWKKF